MTFREWVLEYLTFFLQRKVWIINPLLITPLNATQIPLIDNTPYQETGQITVYNLYLDVQWDNLVYRPKTRSVKAIEQQNQLENEIAKDPDFENQLIATLYIMEKL